MSHSTIYTVYAINDAISGQGSNKHAKFVSIKNARSYTMGPDKLVEGKQKLDFGKKII